MGDFAAEWLSLREPADVRSRDSGLMELLAVWARGRPGLHVLDLGCGTGANLRALAPFLGPGQLWTAIDRDRALLDAVPALAGDGGWSARIAPLCRDLAGFDWPRADLVTASALLDLVSEDWLAGLLERHRGSAFHFALNVDGRVELSPGHPADAAVLAAFARDLRRAKGLGPALGAAAAATAEGMLQRLGYRVALAASDWKLAEQDRPLIEVWLAGVAGASLVRKEVEESLLRDWHETRLRELSQAGLLLRVGHRDLLALPL